MLNILKCKANNKFCILNRVISLSLILLLLLLLIKLGRIKGNNSFNISEIREGIENGNEIIKRKNNKLHRFSKYWLNKYGVPREIPPSSWCNENGVVVSIPVNNNIIKLLNEKVKKMYNKEIPVITEEMIYEEDYDSNTTENRDTKNILKNGEFLVSKGIKISCNGTILIAKSFYEVKGKFINQETTNKLLI
ncbi:hypothetical protein RS030_91562 [Cryptosporidium xiaoi]|uniref:Uncharacterized protein n=1 Tax=Cryptosporidium xiaoi TaxID=659607 RepID=A0AAV9XSE2_9CRYT